MALAKGHDMSSWWQRRIVAIRCSLKSDHLWQRMVKETLATTITVILAFVPAVYRIYGRSMYLGCVTSVFVTPGRRFGQLVEDLALAVFGTLLGSAWSMLGLFLSSLVYHQNEAAAYTIKGVFLALAIFFHGILRSHTPRLWLFVLFVEIVVVVTLTSPAHEATKAAATLVLFPILTACGIVLFVNVFIFPEFSNDCLTVTNIRSIKQTSTTLQDVVAYFAAVPGIISTRGSPTGRPIDLKHLTDAKTNLRVLIANGKATQKECNFEIAWSIVTPKALKLVCGKPLSKLVASIVALISACESKYACVDKDGEDTVHEPGDGIPTKVYKTSKSKQWQNITGMDSDRRTSLINLDLLRPRKEIESADADILHGLISSTAKACCQLSDTIAKSMALTILVLRQGYGNTSQVDHGNHSQVTLSMLDEQIDILSDAIRTYHVDTTNALAQSARLPQLAPERGELVPGEEVFLISSFLLNLHRAATHALSMLRQSRTLFESQQAVGGKRRLHMPTFQWSKWLNSGGEQDSHAMSDKTRNDVRTSNKTESHSRSLATSDGTIADDTAHTFSECAGDIDIGRSARERQAKAASMLFQRSRVMMADAIDYISTSEDVLYALKLTIAVMLLAWPSLVGKWNRWFYDNRGLWASLQLVLVSEVAIGATINTFILRLVGTIIGCTWGWIAARAESGNPYVCVVMLGVGIIPSTYVQLGSQYVKAGMVSVISMCVVALATVDHTVPGTGTENYVKRLIAFLIGGLMALVVQVILFPVRARDRLVDLLASSLMRLTEMEACLAYGIDTESNVDVRSPQIMVRFERAKKKAQASLSAASTFLPFCDKEPRLKGSFKRLSIIYGEMLYVLHAIVDRMENIVVLRNEYGSSVLEDYHAMILPYRRNVVGSIIVILFAIHAALRTKQPLPQFLPSARLAHLQTIRRVAQITKTTNAATKKHGSGKEEEEDRKNRLDSRFLSWNAASAGLMEVIEYLEELIDLAKLLVGAQEFRAGMLQRDAYRAHMGRLASDEPVASRARSSAVPDRRPGLTRRLTARLQGLEPQDDQTGSSQEPGAGSEPADAGNGLPGPLQRVKTKRLEVQRTRSQMSEPG